MKSRILSCFLIFALCFSMLSACGSDTASSDHSPSSSLQTEISDSQDSTPGETEERDGFESLDSASCKEDTVPSQSDAPSASQGQQTESSAPTEITTASSFSLSDVPAYSGKAYTSVNGNVPYFSAAELTTQSFETYSDLDSLGRCGVTYACIGKDLMPTEERGSIGMVKPTGWHTVRYDDLVDGKYLYNRCHLIGYQLTGENANTKNLITGTRYLNIEGMLPFENMVADYIQETNNHVLYRVTPIFEGNNLLANGVLMEGYCKTSDARPRSQNRLSFTMPDRCISKERHQQQTIRIAKMVKAGGSYPSFVGSIPTSYGALFYRERCQQQHNMHPTVIVTIL